LPNAGFCYANVVLARLIDHHRVLFFPHLDSDRVEYIFGDLEFVVKPASKKNDQRKVVGPFVVLFSR
jgi:hypothetical protein